MGRPWEDLQSTGLSCRTATAMTLPRSSPSLSAALPSRQVTSPAMGHLGTHSSVDSCQTQPHRHRQAQTPSPSVHWKVLVRAARTACWASPSAGAQALAETSSGDCNPTLEGPPYRRTARPFC